MINDAFKIIDHPFFSGTALIIGFIALIVALFKPEE